ncbi:hypothetical protein Glove_658g25 [Diversispora epigaea]|uniref:Uncharacterized protein n=1 Tax=Diversispora epigaea TaxID=1348612 RepID=A0A397G548_9GLOM|nr:hypothetical protein Glove_658g25 [Diversispora epigaea]
MPNNSLYRMEDGSTSTAAEWELLLFVDGCGETGLDRNINISHLENIPVIGLPLKHEGNQCHGG